MKRPVLTTCPVRVTSDTSTTERDVETSTRRPARVARISKVWTPLPVSTTTSTLSPFTGPMLLPAAVALPNGSSRSLAATPNRMRVGAQ